MQVDERYKNIIDQISLPSIEPSFLKQLLSLIDLTSLNATDTQTTIDNLLTKAENSYQAVAAICVNPEWVSYVASRLTNKSIRIATVVNFPHGKDTIATVRNQITKAIQDGAQEIDVVFPHELYKQHEEQAAKDLIAACRLTLSEDMLLKVILETGELRDLDLIEAASRDAFIAGADFIKTSTGKTEIGATLPAAAVMLQTIKTMTPLLHRPLGLKVSGGISSIDAARQYFALAQDMMGKEWVNPAHFRIGASKLVDEILLNKS